MVGRVPREWSSVCHGEVVACAVTRGVRGRPGGRVVQTSHHSHRGWGYDDGADSHGLGTARTADSVLSENPPEQCSPSQPGGIAAKGRLACEPGAEMGRGAVHGLLGDDLASPGVIGSEDAMIDSIVLVGWRNQSQDALEELAAREVDGCCTVRPGRLQAEEDRTVGLLFEAFPAKGRAYDIATEALESLTVQWSHADACMQIVPITDSTTRR